MFTVHFQTCPKVNPFKPYTNTRRKTIQYIFILLIASKAVYVLKKKNGLSCFLLDLTMKLRYESFLIIMYHKYTKTQALGALFYCFSEQM